MIGRALIVEDDELVRRTLVRALTGEGHTVESVADGLSALAVIERGRFDVVVSDLSMPGLDGLALLQRLRQRDPDLPVILMTGMPAVETAAQAVELHAARYLVKPVVLADFRAAVAQAMEAGHSARAVHRPAVDPTLQVAFAEALTSLRMVYQPIVRPSERAVYAYEALVRPQHARLSNPPLLFDAAQRLNRVAELGRTIRNLVAARVEATPDSPVVFINLHPFELLDEALYDPKAPLSRIAKKMVLEITERAALEELDDVPGRMARLRRLGFRIALDDLGAGYAGLSSVAQLDPEVVKLDMSMIRGVNGDATRQAMVRSMVQLFTTLGRAVIAEGVETPAELNTLMALGCELFQGYLFARPSANFVLPMWDNILTSAA